MDSIFKRYSNPFLIMDTMLEQSRLEEFVFELAEQKANEQIWDVWMHKVYDKPFDKFKNSIIHKKEKKDPEQVKHTVNDSMNMLKSFNPQSSK